MPRDDSTAELRQDPDAIANRLEANDEVFHDRHLGRLLDRSPQRAEEPHVVDRAVALVNDFLTAAAIADPGDKSQSGIEPLKRVDQGGKAIETVSEKRPGGVG